MNFTYEQAGVNISHTDAVKKGMAAYIGADDPRVLNGFGPFASLYDISFPEIAEPVLVLKAEEPGSKQLLAMEYGYVESIGHDMINHLVNDIAVMGARPLAVLDTVVCGEADSGVIKKLIKGISVACKLNDCTLVGGETSVQPGVVGVGVYILTSTVAGITDKKKIIDGSAIRAGDIILAIASNGLHTNGYSLLRLIMRNRPAIINETVDGVPFIEAAMRPHSAYYNTIKDLFGVASGFAHITGGGIGGNLSRIIPDGLRAAVDLSKINTPPIFGLLKDYGNISEDEMLRAFNCGVGMIAVADKTAADEIIRRVSNDYACCEIGVIEAYDGADKIKFLNSLN